MSAAGDDMFNVVFIPLTNLKRVHFEQKHYRKKMKQE